MSAAIAYGVALPVEDLKKVYGAVEEDALPSAFDIQDGVLYYLRLCWWADNGPLDIDPCHLKIGADAEAAFAEVKKELGLSDFTPTWVLFSM